MGALPMRTTASTRRQNVLIVASVLLLHALALWGLQSGLLQRAVQAVEEVVVPATVITDAPAQQPAPPAPPAKPAPHVPTAAAPRPTAAAAADAAPQTAIAPAAMPQALADASPSANAPQGAVQAAAAAPSAVVAAPAAPAKVELPSSDAEYLHNPKSEYPRISRQRNEQGRVLVSVFIGTDGTAQKAEIKVSSGFDRLDQAALATVKSWRYVPGKRGGVPEAMWFNVPINFVLE